jgi:hypothetical protein
MSVQRLRKIVNSAVPTLFAQIDGGRVRCESEVTLQLHLGRIITTVADLDIVRQRETFSIELEKPLHDEGGKRGRIDIWFRLTSDDGAEWKCALELKFFKMTNHREPLNRYDVFDDIWRLERCRDVADLGFMLVATDHAHYINYPKYADVARDFDFRHNESYKAYSELNYGTERFREPITLEHD